MLIPETCENWLGLVNPCVYFGRQTQRNLPRDVLLREFQWFRGALALISKCSFIWSKGLVNIWNDRKAQNLNARPVNIFPTFYVAISLPSNAILVVAARPWYFHNRNQTLVKTVLILKRDSERSIFMMSFSPLVSRLHSMETWAPSQYKDRLIYVWRFPC